MTGLTPQQIQSFDTEGMLCIPDFLTPSEVADMLERSHQLLDDFDVSTHPRTQFKTGENDHIGDQYFFDSSDKISFFFDVDAFDAATGELKYPKQQAINKIGHGLHMKDKLFEKITFEDKVQAIGRSLNYKDPRVLQSMLIFKQPAKQDELHRENSVPPHADGAFLYTKPQTALGFWFALEDCTPENGCLLYNPGSHKLFPITRRFVKINRGENGCNFIPVDYDTTAPIPDDNPEDYKLVECKAGSLILINSSVLHKSESNRSQKSRFAYAFHLIDGVDGYDALNWLQVPPGPDGGTEFSKLYHQVVA